MSACIFETNTTLVELCSNLVSIFEFEAGDDLTLQFTVLARFVQDGLAELWDVGSTCLPQHWVQTVIWRGRKRRMRTEDATVFFTGLCVWLCVVVCEYLCSVWSASWWSSVYTWDPSAHCSYSALDTGAHSWHPLLYRTAAGESNGVCTDNEI